MTPWSSLWIAEGVSAHGLVAEPMDASIDDVHDGFVRLKRHESSRLWYRKSVPSPGPHETPGEDGPAAEAARAAFAWMRTPSRAASASVSLVGVPSQIAADADWRHVQTGAPVLLLSARPVPGKWHPGPKLGPKMRSRIIGHSDRGPILGPGMRYRVTSKSRSVVSLDVMLVNGDIRSGYANVADLRCMESKIKAGELVPKTGSTDRLRPISSAMRALKSFRDLVVNGGARLMDRRSARGRTAARPVPFS